LSTVPSALTGKEKPSPSAERFMESTHLAAVRDTVMGRCSMYHAAQPASDGIHFTPKAVRLHADVAAPQHARAIFLPRARSPPAPRTVSRGTGRGAGGRVAPVVAPPASGESMPGGGWGTMPTLRLARRTPPMTERLLRGRTLSFRSKPESVDDRASYVYEEDGGILVRHGKIAAIGPYALVAEKAGEVPVEDHRPHLILPGFI